MNRGDWHAIDECGLCRDYYSRGNLLDTFVLRPGATIWDVSERRAQHSDSNELSHLSIAVVLSLRLAERSERVACVVRGNLVRELDDGLQSIKIIHKSSLRSR